MKDKIFEREDAYLSKYAVKSKDTKGRLVFEEPCSMRTEFQRDRDRIIYSKAFIRLKNKTQVFFSPEGDHYMTRLTHTLDVCQIARSLARCLFLNEDLAEAIALGHDLGHTPFGHAGERALNSICPLGFEHNKQSLRVVEVLDNDFKGLNLTSEVKDGILNHKLSGNPKTLEGKCVSYADRIAYLNHDVDDAVRAGIITASSLPKKAVSVLGATSKERINTLISSIVEESTNKNDVQIAPTVLDAMNELREFMFEKVYFIPFAKLQEEKATNMISAMYNYFLKDVDKLPSAYKKLLDRYSKEQVICDYISSMTDRYAVSVFRSIFVPENFS
ncbi:MAG: deoxyguanosinetriphosphate triphosphohydrolase [Clostridia bacterium]|nr:deoxyguanosinetriphosphate triphosphohydrolase [Clostridia bacterium]